MFKGLIALVLVGLLAAFAYQNAAVIEIDILLWTIETRRIVIIATSFFVGLAIGWIVAD